MTDYTFLTEIIDLVADYDKEISVTHQYPRDVDGFKRWIAQNAKSGEKFIAEPAWQGKDSGRSPDSVICTQINHLHRYAKSYSKSAMSNSGFSTQEEFIYLINLKSFGAMGKMELIKKNIHDKPAGMQIISRLIKQGWVEQRISLTDKRSKVLQITKKGLQALQKQMKKIRQASRIVTGPLTTNEKMELIRLLDKLDKFHRPIYHENIESPQLIDRVISDYLPVLN